MLESVDVVLAHRTHIETRLIAIVHLSHVLYLLFANLLVLVIMIGLIISSGLEELLGQVLIQLLIDYLILVVPLLHRHLRHPEHLLLSCRILLLPLEVLLDEPLDVVAFQYFIMCHLNPIARLHLYKE
jgi:hypothetical protein